MSWYLRSLFRQRPRHTRRTPRWPSRAPSPISRRSSSRSS